MAQKFCSQCGQPLSPESKFCTSCGNPVFDEEDLNANENLETEQTFSPTSQSEPAKSPHAGKDYHSLGGWLLFFVVCGFIGGISNISYGIRFIGGISNISYGIRSIVDNTEGFEYSGLFTVAIIVNALALLSAGALMIWSMTMIIGKKTDFLKTYQIAVITCIGGILISNIMLIIAYSSLGVLHLVDNAWGFIGNVIGLCANLVLMTLYYVKSVRTRTYLETDEYIRKALIMKNAPSPEPAD